MENVIIKFYNKKPTQILSNKKKYESLSKLIESTKAYFSNYVKNCINTDHVLITRELKQVFEYAVKNADLDKYIDDFEIVLIPQSATISGLGVQVTIKFIED